MAKSRKLAKLNRAVREVVSTQVLFRIRDPRVRGVTVLDADVAPDGRTAKVYVTVLGDEAAEDRAVEGLESAKGFFQAKIAERLETRYTPVLTFVADGGVKRSIEISRSLQEATGRSLAEPDPAAPEPFTFKKAAKADGAPQKEADSEEADTGEADTGDVETVERAVDGPATRNAFALPDPTSAMEAPPAPDRPDGEYTPPSPVARPPASRPPASRPPVVRPPVHRPAVDRSTAPGADLSAPGAADSSSG